MESSLIKHAHIAHPKIAIKINMYAYHNLSRFPKKNKFPDKSLSV
jgi:hypothetical protein